MVLNIISFYSAAYVGGGVQFERVQQTGAHTTRHGFYLMKY